MRRVLSTLVVAVVVTVQAHSARSDVIEIVHHIQRADYEGDRAALKKLTNALGPFDDKQRFGSRVLYWRGFALWRRAMNGAGHSDVADMEADLVKAAADFRQAAAYDTSFVEARATEAFCLVNVAALNVGTEHARQLFRPAMAQFTEALNQAPDNPRILWMQGANQFYQPAEMGGGHSRALATYERGLELARQVQTSPSDPLEPAWGEPELLMSLAFANLHQAHPDVATARQYAERALAEVPYWHYVRDVLMRDIRRAQRR